MLAFHAHYEAGRPAMWQGRVDDPTDPYAQRWHQCVQCVDLRDLDNLELPDGLNIAILGFCSDEGVHRNLGRPGAAAGPDSIRTEMANLPRYFGPETLLFDAGNLICRKRQLEEAQSDLARAVKHIRSKGMMPLLLGGGHEISLGHYRGLAEESPGIINFDAHFDLRPIDKGPHSGNSFSSLQAEFPETFSCMYLGIQQSANTPQLFKTARSLGCPWIMAMEMREGQLDEVKAHLDVFMASHENLYVTVCADVLSAAFAPGVSSPQPFGLHPEIVVELLKWIMASGKVMALDIAEVSPRFDQDNRTSKLAAILLFACVNALSLPD